ncbi:MAG: CoA transferase [Deltaproteobacteria bacterium]|nr:CoA transferase [Deltaproteobacteria bacterium]MBW2497860.1 CoA transferase [Deltaproteobacteria bacterium]
MKTSNDALRGVRVLEIASGVGGPFCARLLADYGADVIKLEPPGSGDETRAWGPFPQDEADRDASGTFYFLNTNKKSAELDLATRAGSARFLDLVRQTDVLVSSQPAARLRELGIEYASLAAENPRLVMVSVTPFGLAGPFADWKGYDLNAYHLSACGHRYCGRADDAPLEHGSFSAEFFAGYVAAAWGLACLHGRERIGGGQLLDVSSAEVVAALFVGGLNIGGYAQDGIFDRRNGTGMGLAAPAGIVPCRDGHVLLIALEKAQWAGLRRAMGDPEWARAELFDDMWERGRNADLIYSMLEEWTREHTKDEIMRLCQAQRCPATAVYSVADLLSHPHLEAREALVELDHPRLGRIRSLGPPIRLPACPGGPREPAPMLGQHTKEILENASGWRARNTRAEESPTASAAVGSTDERALPLAGVRVANFGWGLVGPTAGQLLAFLGAEVFKIESRAKPDIQRTIPPFFDGVSDPDRSIQNHAFWAGNRSITLDLKTREGRELALQAVSISDVAIENFGGDAMDRLGLGYEDLRSVAPRIILASLSSTGRNGPLAGLRTYGPSLTSLAGLDSVTGYADGELQAMENAFADPLGGVIGALAILLALHHRSRTGEGQHVDFSQLEGTLQLMGPALMDFVLNERIAGPLGNRHPTGFAAPHGVFPCRGEDRWIAIAVASEEEWQGLLAAISDLAPQDWTGSSDFAGSPDRLRHIDALHAHLSEWTRRFERDLLAERLQSFGVAATPVYDVADLLDGPHYRARGTFIEVRHPQGFDETIYGAYVKTTRTRPEIRPGPAVGQDNEHFFRDLLGLSETRYRDLVERRVIY